MNLNRRKPVMLLLVLISLILNLQRPFVRTCYFTYIGERERGGSTLPLNQRAERLTSPCSIPIPSFIMLHQGRVSPLKIGPIAAAGTLGVWLAREGVMHSSIHQKRKVRWQFIYQQTTFRGAGWLFGRWFAFSVIRRSPVLTLSWNSQRYSFG